MNILLLVHVGYAFQNSFGQLQIVSTRFYDGREIAVKGSLAQLASVSAALRNISITSRLFQNSWLIGCVGCKFTVQSCQFEDLANAFGHFAGGKVVLDSVRFERCIRPVTAEGNCRGYVGTTGRLTYNGVDVLVKDCGFTGTFTDESNTPGGAIEIRNGKSLDLRAEQSTGNFFDNCHSGNGWGAALFAEVSSFTCSNLICRNMQTDYSVFHIQSGPSSEPHFTSLSLSGMTFKNIQIQAAASEEETQIQGGGSGLVIRYVDDLTLKWCTVTNCQFTNRKTQLKRAGALLFENMPATGRLTLNDCTFTNSLGKTGCIYIGSQISEFVIGGTSKIDGCGGDSGDHPHSIYVACGTARFSGLTMTNMQGGNGRIWLGAIGSTVSFTSCTFQTWSTTTLFNRTSTGAISFTVENCQFLDVIISDQNLFQAKGDTVTIKGCNFNGIQSLWAIVLAETGAVNFNRMDQNPTKFNNVTITNDQALLTVQTSMTLDGVEFTSMSNLDGILNVVGGTVSISGVKCESVQMRTAKPIFEIRTGVTVSKFETCEFISCISSGSAMVSIHPAPSGGINGLVFRDCDTSKSGVPLLAVAFTNLVLKSCTFEAMKSLRGPPVRIVSQTSSPVTITIADETKFNDLGFEGSNSLALIDLPSEGQVSLTVDGVTVSNSQISSFVSRQVAGTIQISGGTFTSVTLGQSLFDVSSSSFSIAECTFTECTGRLVSSSSQTVDITGCDVDRCNATNPLFEVGCSNLILGDSCFHGSQNIYIKSTATEVTGEFTIPICFDKSQEESVDFGTSDPFASIASHYKIFNCDVCGSNATVDPEIETSIIDESSAIEDSSLEESDELSIDESPESAELSSDESPESDTDSVTATFSETSGDNTKDDRLGPGAIAGIVIAVLVIIAVAILLVWIFVRKAKKSDQDTEASGEREMNEEESATVTATPVVSVDDWAGKVTEDPAMFVSNADYVDDIAGFEENW